MRHGGLLGAGGAGDDACGRVPMLATRGAVDQSPGGGGGGG
ncbi:hypothetical protein KCH_06080 [Kitasatospora cheerisanensis KCTC 2395]|uniref:Uncharacterized protein n=1 Tax=Kitasatospora cheerisanensis KCTC 2395 TaxID=1348663 RepID=A0A066ZBF7_9ACTN|nr:hypothetical protein KCH_06080 [Kitasatospora cheerisanensis KCTC 2395]